MRKVLFFAFIGWLLVCGLSVFDKKPLDFPAVQAVFGEIIDDEKEIVIDFSPLLVYLKKVNIINNETKISPIIISKNEFLNLIFQGVSFFILGIFLLTIFNIFSKNIFYPTIVFGGIIIFLLQYFKILTLKEVFNWIQFYFNYFSLSFSALLGTLFKRLKKILS
jgi:hypothetical protein